MPLDGTVVCCMAYELKKNIIDAKIDKIYQPEKDEIVLQIRSSNQTYKLLLTCNPNYPRIHFTRLSKENPASAPMFCMILRKHLQSGKVVNVVQPNFDRIIEIHVASPNHLGDMTIKRLIIEIMGKHSNIIMVDENNRVIDSIKHVTHEISSIREVLPGSVYFVPPTDKVNPLIADIDSIKALPILHTNQIQKALLHKFIGFSNVMSNEIYYRYSLFNENLEVDFDKLYLEFNRILSQVKTNNFTPTIFLEPDTNKPFDFSAIDLLQYKDYATDVFESISEVIEKYYSQKDQKERTNQKTENLRKHIQILLDRDYRKLEQIDQKLIDAKDKEKYKIWGDLILANLHLFNNPQDNIMVVNYYSPNLETLSIPIDKNISPSQNAQKFYKMYNKLKNTERSSLSLLEHTQSEINYLESVLQNLSYCTLEDDIDQIKIELEQQGFLKHSQSIKKKSCAKSKPLSFVSSDGFTILVGKNNLQNDELTLKTAVKADIWLHTKLIHGSHVIIRTDNKPIPDTTLLEAAALAAFYSKGKNSSNVEVDYTTVKNVKKPSGAKPGMVIYDNYKTIVVTPDENIVKMMKNKKG